MKTVKSLSNIQFKIGEIDQKLYGSFVEHMGRVVYSGIYEPDHSTADEDGFRTDVLEAVKQLGVSTIRYPGGNFVSCYHWEDGVGPKELRPRKLEPAWKAIETNQFGTNEFMKWIKKFGGTPMIAVNLGTRGIEEAVNYLEYCNVAKGTKYSDLRISHGVEAPYNVKLWCLGNEMDGPWQTGHKTAYEYGRLAAETAKAMKAVDPTIQLVVCGSSLKSMDTFPKWEAEVLELTYDYVDYISLHQYFAGQEKGTEAFLAQADEMDQYIKDVVSTIQYVKAVKRSDHNIYISFDEWGVWAYSNKETEKQCDLKRWEEAPSISEMIYTFEDSLLFGGMMLALLKNVDRVKLACQSLLTNISASIMTKRGGECWFQPIYYIFKDVAMYGQGQVLQTITDKDGLIDQVVIYSEEKNEVILFAINRSAKEDIEVESNIEGVRLNEITMHSVLECDDIKATNEEDHTRILPSLLGESRIRENKVKAIYHKASWNVIRIAAEKEER